MVGTRARGAAGNRPFAIAGVTARQSGRGAVARGFGRHTKGAAGRRSARGREDDLSPARRRAACAVWDRVRVEVKLRRAQGRKRGGDEAGGVADKGRPVHSVLPFV